MVDPRNTEPRVLMFSHDTYGLGHLRRSTNIARAIAQEIDDVSILYVTGAARPHCFGLPRSCDVVKLPILTKDGFGRYVPSNLGVSVDLALSLRRGLVFEAVRRFDPHAVLIDHAPYGAAGELRDTLLWLRTHRPQTRVVLGMRDVLDAPSRVAREFGDESLSEIVRQWFDDVLVYGDRRVFDVAKEYDLAPDVAARLHYTGYVCTPVAPAQASTRRRPCVLVMAGGGADGVLLHETVAAALAGPLADADLDVEFTFGPFLDPHEQRRLRKSLAHDARVRTDAFRKDVPQRLRNADVVISMAGANSVAEILDAQVPAILAPRGGPRLEQKTRAERLESLGLARSIDLDERDAPKRLATMVEAALEHRLVPSARMRADCGGAAAAARVLASLLSTPIAANREVNHVAG